MINLLPDEDKALIRREYLRRFIVAAGLFLFVFICVAVILFFPSYFLLVSQKTSLNEQLDVIEESLKRENAASVETQVADLNAKLSSLAEENKVSRISGLIKEIANSRPSSAVKIFSFSYQKKAGEAKGAQVSLNGYAATRNSFLVFSQAIGNMSGVSRVISPPSNLLKEKDLDFTLNIELDEK